MEWIIFRNLKTSVWKNTNADVISPSMRFYSSISKVGQGIMCVTGAEKNGMNI